MRLSTFAQDSLLSVIYQLENIEAEELTISEQNILTTARAYDKEREVQSEA
jgi:hypothetical protein